MGCQWQWIKILESVSVFAISLALIGKCYNLPFLSAPVFALKYYVLKGVLLLSESPGISLHHTQGTIRRVGGWTYIVLDGRHLVRSSACAQKKGTGTEIRGTALPRAASLGLQLTQHPKRLWLCNRAEFGRLWREGFVLLFWLHLNFAFLCCCPFDFICVTGLLFVAVCLLICLVGWF